MKRIVAATACLALAGVLTLGTPLLAPRSVIAGTLSTSIIGLFPRGTGEIAYADMKTARKFPWFAALREQIIPARFRQFEQFLASAGIDPNSQVEELAWGAIPPSSTEGEQILGVALGSFSPESSEARLKQQKVPSIPAHGYNLYAFGTGSGPNDILFFFLDSNTAAFGHRAALERMIDVHFGTAESLLLDQKLMPLVNEANGNGMIWAVLDRYYAQVGVHQILPQADQFPQAAAILKRIHAMEINISGSSDMDAHFQAVCNSVEDANNLAAAMQAGILMRRYQASHEDPALAHVLDNVSVSPAGDRLRVELPVTQDQMSELVRSRAFAVPM